MERPDPSIEGEARAMRDRLHQVLRALDDCVEPVQQPGAAPAAERVRAILRSRRLRDRFFEAGLFADPAWDILLELYAAELSHCRVSVSSLCIGAAVPATTALRWMKALEQKELIVRSHDPLDRRRIYVELSNNGRKAMERLFGAIPELETLL